ncbi:MAG: dihydropteroate synthase [Chloroflexi bacterium]|nr:dihydropteroate synthase [Chloroflexota bacterium]
MGIVNLTPDSFSDGGSLDAPGAANEMVSRMVEEGADIIDIGGESTRPHAQRIPVEEELRRIRPLLEHIGGRLPVPISVDTSRAEVARAALDLGASIVNDVTAMTGDPEMLPLVAGSGAGVVLMHMKGTPATMQDDPRYSDLMREIYLFLHRRVRDCTTGGIPPDRIAIDPGIGFGKTDDHNLDLLARLTEFTSAGLPVLVGPSRKGFIGRLLDLPPRERVEGTIAACTAAVLHGASVVRVHDVLPAVRALRVASAISDRPVQPG